MSTKSKVLAVLCFSCVVIAAAGAFMRVADWGWFLFVGFVFGVACVETKT